MLYALHSNKNFFLISLRQLPAGFPQCAVFQDPPLFFHQWIHLFFHDQAWQVRFWNSDGSSAQACGNGTRCAAHLLVRHYDFPSFTFEGPVGPLLTRVRPARLFDQNTREVEVFQGIPSPLAPEATNHLLSPLEQRFLKTLDPHYSGFEVGNCHIIAFTNQHPFQCAARFHHDFGAKRLAVLPHSPVNISFVNWGTSQISMATWENGTGLTGACGSAACAAFMALRLRRSHLQNAHILCPGGPITLSWSKGIWHTALSHFIASFPSPPS